MCPSSIFRMVAFYICMHVCKPKWMVLYQSSVPSLCDLLVSMVYLSVLKIHCDDDPCYIVIGEVVCIPMHSSHGGCHCNKYCFLIGWFSIIWYLFLLLSNVGCYENAIWMQNQATNVFNISGYWGISKEVLSTVLRFRSNRKLSYDFII